MSYASKLRHREKPGKPQRRSIPSPRTREPANPRTLTIRKDRCSFLRFCQLPNRHNSSNSSRKIVFAVFPATFASLFKNFLLSHHPISKIPLYLKTFCRCLFSSLFRCAAGTVRAFSVPLPYGACRIYWLLAYWGIHCHDRQFKSPWAFAWGNNYALQGAC